MTFLKKCGFSLLFTIFPSILLSEEIMINHNVLALSSVDGKTSISIGLTVQNTSSSFYDNITINFTGPVMLSEDSNGSVVISNLPADSESYTTMNLTVIGDAQMDSIFNNTISFSLNGVDEVGESITLDIYSQGGTL